MSEKESVVSSTTHTVVEVEPTYAEIMNRYNKALECTELVRSLDAGVSEDKGLKIPFLIITNQALPIKEKQIMMVTGGVHGDEECGRAATMAFIEWLLTSGRTYLDTQCFLICPCANPDGAIENTRDTGAGKNIYKSASLNSSGSTCEEAHSILKIAEEYLPECCIDIHGLGGGAVGDGIYVTSALEGNLSLQIGFSVAYEMTRAASDAGFPQRDPYLQKGYNDTSAGVSWIKKTAWDKNTLSFTVEMSEHMYPLEESVVSGLSRMIALVKIGERTQWYQPYSGYPVDILTNNGVTALMSHGINAAERRVSRKEIMRAIHEDGIWSVSRDVAEHANGLSRTAVAVLLCRKELKSYPSRFTLQLQLDKRAIINEVFYNDTKLVPDREHGFEERSDTSGHFVRAHINEAPLPGENRIVITYSMPVEPHDPLPVKPI